MNSRPVSAIFLFIASVLFVTPAGATESSTAFSSNDQDDDANRFSSIPSEQQ
jgi:hypothetical protein